MVRRNLRADFVGGAYVFPGGAVDPADAGGLPGTGVATLTDAEASEILGVGSGGLAYWVAAVRECFEEAGVLLAYGPKGSSGQGARKFVDLVEPGAAERFARHRREMNAGRRQLAEVCSQEDLVLAVDQVHYFAHWITPEGAPRRYDTRFFVAAAPPDQVPAHDEGETIAAEWIRPADALARHREGRMALIFPTIRNLQAIGRFGASGELLAAAAAAAAAASRVPTILPKVVVDGRGVRILLPGDPGYDKAVEAGQLDQPDQLE